MIVLSTIPSFLIRGVYLTSNYHVFLSIFVLPDPVSLVRDHNIKEKLVELGISVQSYNGDLLYEPWEIYDERGYAFTTFEAYWDKCLHMQMEPVSHLPPWRLVPAAGRFQYVQSGSLITNNNKFRIETVDFGATSPATGDEIPMSVLFREENE